MKQTGIILNEPTVIALNTRNGEVLAMGQEAWQMIGRTPGYIVAVRPLRQGAITGFDLAAAIQTSVGAEYPMAIGERTSEDIKIAIGSAEPDVVDVRVEVRGRDLVAGLPRHVQLDPDEVRRAIEEPVAAICEATID